MTFALNDVEAEVSVGDLFQPLGEARLDRIAPNLRFVITPRRAGAGLAGQDALAALDALSEESALLGARLAVAEGMVERREYEPGAADPRTVHLVDTRRFGRMIRASVALGGVVGACDGELPVAAITSAVADLLDEGEGTIRAQVLPSLRRMVAEGMLVVR